MKHLRCLPALLLCLGASGAQAQLLWSDEFNEGNVPDPKTWSYDLGASGWGNQELQMYTDDPDNASVADGSLRITVRSPEDSGGSRFTSARIRTQDKVFFKYGTVEARIRMPDLANGLWPAFWTLGNNFSTVGWPACGELDILEMGSAASIAGGTVNRRVGSTAHWEQNNSHVFYGQSRTAESDLNGEWHLFRMEWTPESVTTYLDGEQIWVIDITEPSCNDCSEFHEPHFLILNVAVGGTYTQRFSNGQITAPTPAVMEVDYVRLFDNGHTELDGSGVENEPPPIGSAHSGSWYNAGQSGHGFSMEFGRLEDGSPLAVIYWYLYDDEGNPLFMIGTGVPDGNVLDVQFQSPVGMRFGEFDPDSVVRESGGTGRFEFSDRDNATFSYTPSDFSTSQWGHSTVDDLALVKLFDIGDFATR